MNEKIKPTHTTPPPLEPNTTVSNEESNKVKQTRTQQQKGLARWLAVNNSVEPTDKINLKTGDSKSKSLSSKYLIWLVLITLMGGGIYEYKNSLSAYFGEFFHSEEKEANEYLSAAKKIFHKNKLDLNGATIAKVYSKHKDDKRKDFLFLVVVLANKDLYAVTENGGKYSAKKMSTLSANNLKGQIETLFGKSKDTDKVRIITYTEN